MSGIQTMSINPGRPCVGEGLSIYSVLENIRIISVLLQSRDKFAVNFTFYTASFKEMVSI